MPLRRVSACAFQIAAIVLVAIAVLLAPAGHSTSHDPLALAAAEAEGHAELAAEISAHGHSHDDGDWDEQAPGHSHGHNPGDHLHDKAGVPPVFALAALAIHDVTLMGGIEVGRGGPPPSFKRPPRSAFAA